MQPWLMTAPMQHDPHPNVEFNALDPASDWQTFTGETGSNGIRDVMLVVSRQLAEAILIPEGLRENAEVVIAEVLNNIAEHSYKGEAGGKLQLRLGLHATWIDVETQDFGVPMPGLDIPAKRQPNPDAPAAALQEGGFGWYLIHTLAPKPHYIRRGKTNILRFRVTESALN